MRIIYLVISYFFIYNIKCNNKPYKMLFFELDEDLVIKNIFLKQYNDYFNLLIDTMGFISGLFLSKKLRYDFILGKIFSPINSYRTFEGHTAELNLQSSSNYYIHDNNFSINIFFPIAIFKVYNKIKFYDKNIKYNGIIGLALNYTEEVLLDESYFFGEDKKYSIMEHLKNDLKLIEHNTFSFYKDKFIIGEINVYNNYSKIDYCKCEDKIYDSFIYFFWNCNVENILIDNVINNYYEDIKISLLFDSLLKDNLLSTNKKIGNIILSQINNIFSNLKVCDINNSYIFCLNEYYNRIYDMNFKIILNNKTNIELPFNLILKNKREKYFYLGIEIYEFNIDKNQNIIRIGKKIFDHYYVVFDQVNKRIGLQKLENININLNEKYNYKNLFPHNKNSLNEYKLFLIKLLLSIIIYICFIGIIILFYAKNNIHL